MAADEALALAFTDYCQLYWADTDKVMGRNLHLVVTRSGKVVMAEDTRNPPWNLCALRQIIRQALKTKGTILGLIKEGFFHFENFRHKYQEVYKKKRAAQSHHFFCRRTKISVSAAVIGRLIW